MPKFTLTIEVDSAEDLGSIVSRILSDGTASATNNVQMAMPAPAPRAPRAPSVPTAPAPVPRAPTAPTQAPRVPTAPAMPAQAPRAPKRNQQQLADAIVHLLADGTPRSITEVARGIGTPAQSATAPLLVLLREGHVIDNGGRYTLAQIADEGVDDCTDDGIPFPPGDDD